MVRNSLTWKTTTGGTSTPNKKLSITIKVLPLAGSRSKTGLRDRLVTWQILCPNSPTFLCMSIHGQAGTGRRQALGMWIQISKPASIVATLVHRAVFSLSFKTTWIQSGRSLNQVPTYVLPSISSQLGSIFRKWIVILPFLPLFLDRCCKSEHDQLKIWRCLALSTTSGYYIQLWERWQVAIRLSKKPHVTTPSLRWSHEAIDWLRPPLQ